MAITKRKNARGEESSDSIASLSSQAEVEDLKDSLQEEIAEVKAKRHHKHPWYRRRRFIFPLGLTLGVGLGLSFIEPSSLPDLSGMQDIPNHISIFMQDMPGLSMPSLDFARVESEWLRLRNSIQIPEVWKLARDGREFKVGEEASARGLSAKFPVVLVPGVISTGLESWSTSPEYREFFRMRVWGGVHMVSQVMFNHDKWLSAMMLDPVTGLDPPGVKVRAAEGIEAASSFIQGYWLWSKIVENLAAVNYDTNNLYLAPYDWRLSYHNLEVRDGYFSRLKTTIEGFKQRQNQKIVLAAHSMGSTVILYFFKWVESPEHGKGGPDWVENHIEALVSIAGTHLGVSKAMTAYLSGEMRDTVQLNPAGAYVLERFFSKKERRKLFLSWAGAASMWIKGGASVWGDDSGAPDDPLENTHTHGTFLSFRQGPGNSAADAVDSGDGVLGNHTTPTGAAAVLERVGAAAGVDTHLGTRAQRGEASDMRNMTAADVATWILTRTPTAFQRMMEANYSIGIERDEARLVRNNADPTKWTNPLEIQLPHAPSMKMYCVYGHGKETERSYWYTRGDYEFDDVQPDVADATCPDHDSADCGSPRPALDMPLSRKSWIDFEYSDTAAKPPILNGVSIGEGDGTVSLLSLGAMCVEGWQRKRWNPTGIRVVTVELPHNPSPTMPRGGANTSEHVDILGSTRLNDIIVKVATGAGDEIREEFVSNIREYARKVRWD